ncbi:MAG: Uma2 family endonuclease [Verrucomicrobiaceae bacterium]|nr:Uma2 family endonuclease [Verrucomicrobiaceae bacterium]
MTTKAELIYLDPDFPVMLDELNTAWKEEQQRRRIFREELTPEMKAEFIEGQVIMHSPAMARHILATKHLCILLQTWVAEHRLGLVTMEKALVCLTRNDYEPDIAFFKGFTAQSVSPTLMEFPAPDFVVEVISPSTEHYDRGIKMKDYASHGVSEYWMVDCKLRIVEQYLLNTEARRYDAPSKHEESARVRSKVIEGFEIPVAAIFDEHAQHEAMKEMMKLF